MKWKLAFATTIVLVLLFAGTAAYLHFDLYSIPGDRMGLNATYPEMKKDDFHQYLNFLIDHNNASKGEFRGFYILSPHFYESRNVTFFLTDGQMELVSTDSDLSFFEEILGPSSYVLIGVRGHAPTYLPGVYRNGHVDLPSALYLYNSEQQVEDIEQVRLEMARSGLLSGDGKINIFGASGAGILGQQYVSKYGEHVNRVILESTGAPDISKNLGLKYSPDFKEFNPDAAAVLEEIQRNGSINRAAVSNILYQEGRSADSPRETQSQIVDELKKGSWLLRYRLDPVNNLSLLDYILKAPRSIAARVRWFELVGYDLLRYDPNKDVNLLYDISAETLSDIVAHFHTNGLSPKEFEIKRAFQGEVLILKGTEDVVFGDEVNKSLAQKYANARLLFFKDGHRMQKDREKYRNIRSSFLEAGFASELLKNTGYENERAIGKI